MQKDMADALIKKVEGGHRVDGLELLGVKCGCGGLHGPGSRGMKDCCFTYSTVKHEDNTVAFFAKATTPSTKDNYEWGYRVKKGPVEVDVLVYDTRNPKDSKFAGIYPPPVSAWQERGWKVVDQFERPLRELRPGGRPRVEIPKTDVHPDEELGSHHGDLFPQSGNLKNPTLC